MCKVWLLAIAAAALFAQAPKYGVGRAPTPEEIKVAWDKRDASKTRTATYGAGSWIATSGKDGGLEVLDG